MVKSFDLSFLAQECPGTTAAEVDARDFTLLYREHCQAVFYLALRLTGNATQAEDVTHDVFLKAFRAADRFEGTAAVRTWLYRITLNHCANLRKSWSARNIHSSGEEADLERPSSPDRIPSAVLESKELGERIQKALESLTPEYRLVLLLVADESLSYEQVGQLTQQSADAVRGKLHRARKAFAVAFNEGPTSFGRSQ
jgi:RNA polymerase sigma-70 factor, ECF subfamily